jgi:hypothetical protein
MAVPLGLQPGMKVLKVGLQMPPIRFLGDPIHPYRRLCTLAAIGSLEGWHIDQMGQCVELAFGFALRSLHYLQESW